MKGLKTTTRSITLQGIRPIMFDRYAGDNDTKLAVEDKMYYLPDTRKICIPSQNILSMLGSQQYDCAAKQKYGRGYQKKANAAQGFIDIDPINVPIRREGKEIVFEKFGKGGFDIIEATARVKKGTTVVPNPKVRPVLTLPWELSFTLSILPNQQISEADIKDLFEIGGLNIGIGTWRGQFGKFIVEKWE